MAAAKCIQEYGDNAGRYIETAVKRAFCDVVRNESDIKRSKRKQDQEDYPTPKRKPCEDFNGWISRREVPTEVESETVRWGYGKGDYEKSKPSGQRILDPAFDDVIIAFSDNEDEPAARARQLSEATQTPISRCHLKMLARMYKIREQGPW